MLAAAHSSRLSTNGVRPHMLDRMSADLKPDSPRLLATQSAASSYARFCRLAWSCSPGLSIAVIIATVVATAAPFAVVVSSGMVLGRLPAAVAGDASARSTLIVLAVVLGCLVGLQWVAWSVREVTSDALGDRIDLRLQSELMGCVMAPPGLRHLETPGIVDLIAVGRDTFSQWLKPGRMVLDLSALCSAYLILGGACVVITWTAPLAGPLLLAGSLWSATEGRKVAASAAEMHYGSSPESRRASYFYELGTEPPAAKEIRVFSLPEFIQANYLGFWRRAHKHAFAKSTGRELLAVAAQFAVAAALLAWISWAALRGRIDAAQAFVVAQAAVLALASTGALGSARLRTTMALRTLRRHDEAVAAVELDPPVGSLLPTGGSAPEIRFEDVSFRYPGSDVDVISDLNLTVPAGKSVALVGINGVGKTTLVKLLCRFYQPTAGRILVDGTDLASYDATSWQRNIAAVFQETVRWELSAAANIGFGHPDHADDRAGVRAAAEQSGAAPVIARLEHGFDTSLSTRYMEGSDLSGGEWQKIALARALFALKHGAQVLLLDEPAAHLDARSEAALYAQYLEITANRTTVVVSHRFSTVRQASFIVVLDSGQVIECGDHDELMMLDGRYASMFKLQAENFNDPDLKDDDHSEAGLDQTSAEEVQ